MTALQGRAPRSAPLPAGVPLRPLAWMVWRRSLRPSGARLRPSNVQSAGGRDFVGPPHASRTAGRTVQAASLSRPRSWWVRQWPLAQPSATPDSGPPRRGPL
eukprot:14814886-Alexandrium_andersonii.AAC.1